MNRRDIWEICATANIGSDQRGIESNLHTNHSTSKPATREIKGNRCHIRVKSDHADSPSHPTVLNFTSPQLIPNILFTDVRKNFTISKMTSAFITTGAAIPRLAPANHRACTTLRRSSFVAATHASRARIVSAQKEVKNASWSMVSGEEPRPAAGPLSNLGLSPAVANTAYVGFLFFLWYFFNIIFNIMNKKVLNAWSNPWILSTVQLGVGSIMVLLQWGLRIQEPPKISGKLLKALFLPTLSHLVGHVSTCISFSYVAVSFSHIVKACEPAFGALGSAIVLGEIYSPGVYATLLPIILGVALSAVTQLQFFMARFLICYAFQCSVRI